VVGAAMRTMSHPGVVGSYSYDANGNLKASTVTMYTFKNGALVALPN
jgi:branched-chain amino acid transport system substrate-binding protein